MANLNAMVDAFLHPEIPYFDEEHLIVGGITGSLTAILFGALLFYYIRLEMAFEKIKKLEGLLPICSSCKKIRDPEDRWHEVEEYITEKTDVTFSHGICPECHKKLYGKFLNEHERQRF